MAFLLKRSLLFRIFLLISLNQARTRSDTLIESLGRWYRGHNMPKTGQKWLNMAKIGIFIIRPLLFWIFSLISLNSIWTKSNKLNESFKNWYRGLNRPKTGQRWPKMAKIYFFIFTFFVNLTISSTVLLKQFWVKSHITVGFSAFLSSIGV